MELSLDELHSYISCPMQYEIKYKYGHQGEVSPNVAYREALHKTISYFYFAVMGGRVPTSKQMKDKWASLWTEAIADKGEFLLKERSSRTPQSAKLNIQGFEMIHNFHHFNKDDPGTPIAVDHEYRVPIVGVTLTGKFELIRETIDKTISNRFIEIVDFKTGSDSIDPFMIKHDINMTAASYAFRNLFQSKEDRLIYHYLKTGKEIHSLRDDKEFDRFKKMVDGVANGIARGHFYPRHNFMCKTCPVQNICDRIKF